MVMIYVCNYYRKPLKSQNSLQDGLNQDKHKTYFIDSISLVYEVNTFTMMYWTFSPSV